jgi:hypothetical protein
MSKIVCRTGTMTVVSFGTLGLCLATESFLVRTRSAFGSALREISAALHDPGLQWLVTFSIAIYFFGFCWIRVRQPRCSLLEPKTPSFWLAGAMLIALISYFLNYADSVQSTATLVLLTSAALGQGVEAWSGWRIRKRGGMARIIVYSLLVLLFGASLWWGDYAGESPQYHGSTRWSGPWNNPNTYGLLMGTGFVLSVAEIVQRQRPGKRQREALRMWLRRGLLTLCAGSLGIGLLRSYSRGAWLGTFCALCYLGKRVFNPQLSVSGLRMHVNAFLVGMITVSLSILAFWHFQETDYLPARRAFSVFNMADFSWRNRISAWEGALQIIGEHPLIGTGWNQPELFFQHYYLSPRMSEGMAIGTNDFLMFGAILGIPAMFCFLAYIFLFLRKLSKTGVESPELAMFKWLQTSCWAGAIVLVVGFCFDGGLFKLPTAATFWILLELGSVTTDDPRFSLIKSGA